MDSKISDDQILLQQVLQSNTCMSQISSAVISKWLSDTTLDLINTLDIDSIYPNRKTADGDTLLEVICQSQKRISLIPSALLLEWVHYNTTDESIPS